MSVTITDRSMISAYTEHTAAPWSDPEEPHVAGLGPEDIGWRVTWLPDRLLTYDEAITAMTIAEAVGRIPAHSGPEAYDAAFWTLMDSLAAELGLAGPSAVAQVSEVPAGGDLEECDELEWDSGDSNAYQDRVEAGLEPEDGDGL